MRILWSVRVVKCLVLLKQNIYFKGLFTPSLSDGVIHLYLYHSHEALALTLSLMLENGFQTHSKASTLTPVLNKA